MVNTKEFFEDLCKNSEKIKKKKVECWTSGLVDESYYVYEIPDTYYSEDPNYGYDTNLVNQSNFKFFEDKYPGLFDYYHIHDYKKGAFVCNSLPKNLEDGHILLQLEKDLENLQNYIILDEDLHAKLTEEFFEECWNSYLAWDFMYSFEDEEDDIEEIYEDMSYKDMLNIYYIICTYYSHIANGNIGDYEIRSDGVYFPYKKELIRAFATYAKENLL